MGPWVSEAERVVPVRPREPAWTVRSGRKSAAKRQGNATWTAREGAGAEVRNLGVGGG